MRGEPLYLDGNDDKPRVRISRVNETTGADEPATGLTGLTVRLSATRSGLAIHAALEKALVEGWTEGVDRIYHATFEGTDLTAQLAPYAGLDVYQVSSDGGNINYSIARRVIAVRP